MVAGESDRWKVDGAIGVSVSIPPERMSAIGELLTSDIDTLESLVFDYLYFTTGQGTVNGQPTEHSKITVFGDSPSDRPPFIVPLPAVVANADSPSAGMMWRHGYIRIDGEVRIARDGTAVEVTTDGGRLSARAVFDGETESWERTAELRPIPESPSGHIGPEGGTRKHGSGHVTVEQKDGNPFEFDTYIGFDTDLFWDYTFPISTPRP